MQPDIAACQELIDLLSGFEWTRRYPKDEPGHSYPGNELVERAATTIAALLDHVEELTANPAVADVLAERRRQIGVEGWTAEHDKQHSDGSLAQAAACYALPHPEMFQPGWPAGQSPQPKLWPWANSWWKPKDRRRDLVRAAALLLAEIERLDRKA